MFTFCSHSRVNDVLIGIVAGFCIFVNPARGQEAAAMLPLSEKGDPLPAVEQALVPEGVFALQLAEVLKLGQVSGQIEAEKRLSDLGIEPERGWIDEFPVTPEVFDKIEKDVVSVFGRRKLNLNAEQALKAVSELKSRLGFTAKPKAVMPTASTPKPGRSGLYQYTDAKGLTHFTDVYDSIPEAFRKDAKKLTPPKPPKITLQPNSAPEPEQVAKPNPEIIDRYYDDYGPPAVTYYAPPEAYDYLYQWVAYPFWSSGYYFPGYYLLNDFRRQIYFKRQRFFVGHHHQGHPVEPPVNAAPSAEPWQSPQHGGTPPERWYQNADAEAGAREIAAHRHHHTHDREEAVQSGSGPLPFTVGDRINRQSREPSHIDRDNETYPENAPAMPNQFNDSDFNDEAQAQQGHRRHGRSDDAGHVYGYDAPQPYFPQNAGTSRDGGVFHGEGFSKPSGGFNGGNWRERR